MAASYNSSREGWGEGVVRGREVSDVNEGGFILGNVSWSPPLVSQQLWLWFEAGQIQPVNLMGDVEQCCRCISWMQRELLVAKQEMKNPESLN